MDFDTILVKLKSVFTPSLVGKLIGVGITILIIYVVYRLTRKYLRNFAEKILKIQNVEAIEKAIKFFFKVAVVLYITSLFGTNLAPLLGAAGIMSVAIGFAAQTSFSNIISGFFVIGDHALKVGDFVTVEDVTGTVQSMDLLSVKILTPDNHMIRVPNETIIKTNLINTTYYPYRRMTVRISVAYKTDLRKVNDILLTTAKSCEMVLENPAPLVIFDKFAESGIEVMLAVWFKKENFLAVKNAMYIGMHENFNTEGISIPFPQVDVRIKDNSSPKQDTAAFLPVVLPVTERKGSTRPQRKSKGSSSILLK